MKSWKEVLAIAAILLVLAWILRPVTHGHRGQGTHSRCLSNVKQQALATLMYSADHDDRMPHRDAWMDLVKPFYYTSNFEDRLHCPAIKDKSHYGYALNSLITKLGTFEQDANVLMIYESMNLARNASDPLLSILGESRHPHQRTIVIGFADGHAAGKLPGWVESVRR